MARKAEKSEKKKKSDKKTIKIKFSRKTQLLLKIETIY